MYVKYPPFSQSYKIWIYLLGKGCCINSNQLQRNRVIYFSTKLIVIVHFLPDISHPYIFILVQKNVSILTWKLSTWIRMFFTHLKQKKKRIKRFIPCIETHIPNLTSRSMLKQFFGYINNFHHIISRKKKKKKCLRLFV